MSFDLNDEIREGYLVTSKMKKVWAVELDLLETFLEYCKRNNLKCWVEGGTLLGAVRHKGFIPWDDDIDLAMLREDYDRMCKIGNEGLDEPYFLQTVYNDVEYHRGHAQFRRSDTTGIRPSDSYERFNQGIFIDIFPLDAVPDDRQLVRKYCRRCMNTFSLLKSKNKNLWASGRYSLVFRKIRAKYLVWRHGWLNVYLKGEDLMRELGKMPHTKVAELTFSEDRIVWDKSVFDETVYLPFEYLMVPAPKKYEEFLKEAYGLNYMTPIKAPNMHGAVVFDTEHSYVELLPVVRREYRLSIFRRLKEKLFKKG